MNMIDGENLFPQNYIDTQMIIKCYIFRRSNFINLLFVAPNSKNIYKIA